MKLKLTMVLIVLAGLAAAAVVVQGMGQSDLAGVRAATARFQRVEVARAAGWDLVPGLDSCFSNPGVGAMGYHYIHTGLLDTVVEADRPESLVYAPGPQGQLKLAAVEYIVPAGPWDDAGNTTPPSLFGQSFHLNEALGVYVLHAWIWMNNPAGLFEDWNPAVTCG